MSVRLALAALSLSMLLASLGTSIANVALPSLAHAFAAPFQDVQWIVLAYLLASTTLIVSVGRLGDATGRRRLLVTGLAVFTGASALCGIAPTLWLLVGARALQGAGAAILLALSMAFVGETVPKERTGGAMGVLGTMSAIGTALGPSLGGILIAAFGWRSIFLINLPLGIAALFLTLRYVPAERRRPSTVRERFDYAGTLLLAATLAAYALAMTFARGRFGVVSATLLAAAVCGGAAFALVERRAASPLVRLTMLRDTTLVAALILSLIVSTVVMSALVVGPFYLSRAFGLGAAAVGLVITLGPLLVAVAGIPAGRLSDRLGAAVVTRAGLVVLLAGALAFAFVPATLGVAGFIVPLLAVTGGYALFQISNSTEVMANVAADRRGVVSGMVNLARNLGLITGTSVMGGIFALASGAIDVATASADAVATGLHATFGVAAVLVAGALVIARRPRSSAAATAAPPVPAPRPAPPA